MSGGQIQTHTLTDSAGSFEVSLVETRDPARACLFSVGAGGDPLRHRSLLHSLAMSGSTVVAPKFERITRPCPDAETLTTRARRLDLALRTFARTELPVVGVGHSIGAALLLVLASGVAHTIAGDPVALRGARSFARLVLLAPPADFFRVDQALDGVAVPVEIWVGRKDTLTPHHQSELLRTLMAPRAPAELHVLDDAGHFSFMEELPPHVVDPQPDRRQFLQAMAAEICRSVST